MSLDTAENLSLNSEMPFAIGEVLLSRTDKRGIIQSCNKVFQRVSGYPPDQLLGAPHRMIRHPDMPKAVFHLFWDRLQAGLPVGAYVKNRVNDGRYYWVYALAMPCQDGYLSVRIKPTSPHLDQIKTLYEGLRADEIDHKVSPQDSAANLLNKLQDIGFRDYAEFMYVSLGEELLSESTSLGTPPDTRITLSREQLKNADALAEQTEGLGDEFRLLMDVPQNMRVVAARLEPTGGPFTALSRNYGQMSDETSKWFETEIVGEGTTFTKIAFDCQEALQAACIAGILRRCMVQLDTEAESVATTSHADAPLERDRLWVLEQQARAASLTAASNVITSVKRILAACDDTRRRMLALDTVRIACKIENARPAMQNENIDGIIIQLLQSQQRIEKRLETIRMLSADIRRDAIAMT